MARIIVRVRGDPGIAGISDSVALRGDPVNWQEDAPEYEGAYVVTPSRGEQVLPTAGRRMTEDLTIQATPWMEVDNEGGGKTATILS